VAYICGMTIHALKARQPRFGPAKLWAISRTLHQRGHKRLAKAAKGVNFLLFKTILPPEAVVGDGVQVRHYGLGTVVHPNTTLGDDVMLWHGVTIGSTAQIGGDSRIEVGDHVRVGAGAMLLNAEGNTLRIGSNVRIDAGAIVTEDVPDGARVRAPRPVVT
jgi:serine O-acetyltransferase